MTDDAALLLSMHLENHLDDFFHQLEVVPSQTTHNIIASFLSLYDTQGIFYPIPSHPIHTWFTTANVIGTPPGPASLGRVVVWSCSVDVVFDTRLENCLSVRIEQYYRAMKLYDRGLLID